LVPLLVADYVRIGVGSCRFLYSFCFTGDCVRMYGKRSNPVHVLADFGEDEIWRCVLKSL